MNSPETGYKITSAQDITEVDIDRLTYLINDSFESSKKELVKDYFEKEDITEIFYEENYLGAAIIQSINGIPYIDKYVVEKSYQGNGLGTALWNAITGRDALTDRYDKLIWRASPDNPANEFYNSRCDGMKKRYDWNIYYINLTEDELKEAIPKVASKEPTMIST